MDEDHGELRVSDLGEIDVESRHLNGVERLWLYVLLDAIERWREKKREAKREAYAWLFLADGGGIGSCSWICNALGINKARLQQKLEAGRLGFVFKGRNVSGIVKEL